MKDLKKISISIVLIVILNLNANSQQYSINGTISQLSNSKVYLAKIIGQTKKVIDTATSDETGSFKYVLGENATTGMYSIITGGQQNIELLFNHENIRFISSGSTADDNVQIIESVENLIWYDYLYTKGFNQYKMEVIEQLMMSYPPGDEYFKYTENYYQKLQQTIISRCNELISNNPNTLAAKYINVDMPVFAPYGMKDSKKQAYLIHHHFDNTDFSDTLLLRSNILTSKIIKYLSLYQKPGDSKEQLEDNLIVAVDSIFDKAIVDQKVYESVVDFLINGFEAIGFEKGLEHIAEQNQLSELCVNTNRKEDLEQKMEMIKKLAIGKTAPDFSVKDMNGEMVKLKDIDSETTILIFWASWCPHCTETLPVLKEYYNKDKTDKLQVIAISIDENEEDFKNAVTSHSYNWINIAELKGWEGATVLEYGVHATPTIFVLDKDKKILAKPINKENLRKAIENL
jgi:peroxiredoxin